MALGRNSRSFLAPDAVHLGIADIVVCAPVVAAEAQAQGIALADHYAHLLVHGTLHAQGHDHEDAADAERMETAESRILAGLGLADPYRRV